MMQRVRRGVQILPLLGALALVGWLPALALGPLTGVFVRSWRLDALTLTLLLSLALGLAAIPLGGRDLLRALAAAALLTPALLLEHLLALPLALLAVGALLGSWRWLIAAALLGLGLLPIYQVGAASWYAATITLSSPLFLLLLLATYVGLEGYPLGLLRARSAHPPQPLLLALQPIWLLPLLRTLAWGPWNSGWALAALLLGGGTALWASGSAVWSAPAARVERIAGTWLALALACVGLVTPVGTASALWQTLAYPLGLGLLLAGRDTRRWALWAAPVPLTATFVAGWLAQGAIAASGTLLLAASCWLATLLSGLATLRHGLEAAPPTDPRTGWAGGLLAGLSLALGVLAPLPLRWLIVPAIDPLQGGLTPFGLLDIWPWVGLAALDAGQRRVAVLPSIAVAVLALVAAALVWLLARALPRRSLTPVSAEDISPDPAARGALWAELRRRVWWAGGARRSD